ncbi:MAG: nitroreductase family protein [Actinomycetota bacterium]
MELQDAIRARHMVRAFSPEPLDPEALDGLLDLARRAPSAGNTAAAGFVVLDRPELVARYWDVTLPGSTAEGKRAGFRWQQLLDAPVLVLVTTEPGRYLDRYSEPDKQRTGRGDSPERWPVPYWWVDVGTVIQNLLLLATDADLGACLFGPFDHEPAIKNEFDIPEPVRIAATIALGRPLPDQPGRSAARGRAPRSAVITRPD